jgi:hypothetical protein
MVVLPELDRLGVTMASLREIDPTEHDAVAIRLESLLREWRGRREPVDRSNPTEIDDLRTATDEELFNALDEFRSSPPTAPHDSPFAQEGFHGVGQQREAT